MIYILMLIPISMITCILAIARQRRLLYYKECDRIYWILWNEYVKTIPEERPHIDHFHYDHAVECTSAWYDLFGSRPWRWLAPEMPKISADVTLSLKMLWKAKQLLDKD